MVILSQNEHVAVTWNKIYLYLNCISDQRIRHVNRGEKEKKIYRKITEKE